MALNKWLRKLIRVLLPLLFWLAVWQGVAWLVELRVSGRGNELLLPYPVSVLRSLIRLGQEVAFWQNVVASVMRVLAGMAVGTMVGVVLAVLTCAYRWCDNLFSPAIRVIRVTPVASFILLVLLWTSRNAVPGIIAGMMVMPVIWEDLSQSIRSVDPKLLEMAEAYRFTRLKKLVLIYIPSLRPHFLGTVTTAMGLAWKSGVAAEVLCLPKRAIGTQIYNSKLYLEVPDLFAWTVVVILLSLILEKLLRFYIVKAGGER